MWASSSDDGSRSNSCSSLLNALLILLSDPTWFRGNLTIRDCSASACRIDWRIHQTAYEINLKPRVSSNLLAALINPRFPSLIKSGKTESLVLILFRNRNYESEIGFS
jgi:hypothetical protein